MVFDHPPAAGTGFDREALYAGQTSFGQKGHHLQPFPLPPQGDRALGIFMTGITFDLDFHSTHRYRLIAQA